MANLIFTFDDLKSYDGLKGCVFTNGCFDILHRGHIELFKFAYQQTKLGQSAVVGVNSDKSIKESNLPK